MEELNGEIWMDSAVVYKSYDDAEGRVRSFTSFHLVCFSSLLSFYLFYCNFFILIVVSHSDLLGVG